MEFVVLTLFPELIQPFFRSGVLGRAFENGIVSGRAVNIRDFATDRHHTVDDRPYGGGCGMVIKPAPLDAALRDVKRRTPGARTLLMTPQGTTFTQERARCFAAGESGLVFVCGRYEGIDERIYQAHVDEEVSLGDFVMSGGELAAMAVIDAVARLIPGVLGKEQSAETDSFKGDRLEYAHYTRPMDFRGRKVPKTLLSGNHGEIEAFRERSSLLRTLIKRPDLFEKRRPDKQEKRVLTELCREIERFVKE